VWALDRYRESGLDGIAEATFCLGRHLTGYLRDALTDGLTTRAEIATSVPGELLPYADRLRIERQPTPDYNSIFDCLLGVAGPGV